MRGEEDEFEREKKRVRGRYFAVAEEMRYFDSDAGAWELLGVTFFYFFANSTSKNDFLPRLL